MYAPRSDSSADYDGDLQMFRAQPRDLNMQTLRFLRWLAEHGQLEHGVVGPSVDTGERVHESAAA